MNADDAGPIRDMMMDSAKAAVPIGGGVFLQWLHYGDAVVVFIAHAAGAAAAVLGLIWYVRQMRRDWNKNSHE
jgi:hypothetical protein